jgi:PiT family inorganic phosphate transporter
MALFSVEALGLAALFVLAFANGANDVGKSVASLMEPGPQGKPRRRGPLLWGGILTGLGSVSAIVISGRLFSVFTPQSILTTTPESSFILIAIVGATLWILGATLLKIPVSSTHAIVGAIVFPAVYLFGVSGLDWYFLAVRVLLPLAGGPIAAMIGVYLLERVTQRARTPGKERPRVAKASHWGAAGMTAYARGINDAPKMAALGAFFLLTSSASSMWVTYSIVTIAVVLGSLVLGHRVALELIGKDVPLEHNQRARAGIATAALVTAGAYFGAPMSTSQVQAGSKAGSHGRSVVIRSALRGMALAWLVTLPAAGLLAIATSYVWPRYLAPLL